MRVVSLDALRDNDCDTVYSTRARQRRKRAELYAYRRLLDMDGRLDGAKQWPACDNLRHVQKRTSPDQAPQGKGAHSSD